MTWIPPSSVVLTWPRPNYVDPAVRGPGTLIVNVVLAPIALFVVAIRIYTRLYISNSFGPDDWFMIIALLPALAFTVSTAYATQALGVQRHIWDIPLDMADMALKMVLVAEVSFMFACSFTKLSMLFLIRRMTKQSTGYLPLLVNVVIALIVACMIALPLATIFQCQPVSDIWTFVLDPPHCTDQAKLLLAGGIDNTIMDFAIVLLPIPVVLKLSLPRRQQVIVMGLFAAGFVVCIAGIARTYYTWLATTSYDASWDGYAVFLSSTVEMYIGILGASVPPTRPFFRRYLPRFLSKVNSTLAKTERGTTVASVHDRAEDHNGDGDVPLRQVDKSVTFERNAYVGQDRLSESSDDLHKQDPVDNVIQSDADLEKEAGQDHSWDRDRARGMNRPLSPMFDWKAPGDGASRDSRWR